MVTAKQIINSTKPKIIKVPDGQTAKGSAGYDNPRDDIEKVKKMREGSVEKVPVFDNDIVNKAYADSKDFWQRVGSVLSPKTAGDDITTTGTGTFGSAVINEDGLSTGDFRVEGDTDANLFFVDASSDRIGIGTNTPSRMLHMRGDDSLIRVERMGSYGAGFDMWRYSGSVASPGNIGANAELGQFTFRGYLSGAITVINSFKSYTKDTSGNGYFLFADGAGTEKVRIDTETGDITTTGSLSVGDVVSDLYFTGAGTGLAYGELYAHDVDSDLVMAAQDTWYQCISFDTNGLSNLATPDHTNDHITIVKTGVYKIFLNAGLKSATAEDWVISPFKNNGATQLPCADVHFTTIAGAKEITSSNSCIVSLTAGDTLEVWAMRTTSGGASKTLTFNNVGINLVMVGG